MTTAEQKTINELTALVGSFIRKSEEEKQSLLAKVSELEKRLERSPTELEPRILSTCQSAISDAIKNVLTGYNSPLSALILSVVNSHSAELRDIINGSFEQVIRTEDFKKSILEAFSHKIARGVISGQQGLFDQVANELKQDAVFRSKVTVAIANVVNECLNSK